MRQQVRMKLTPALCVQRELRWPVRGRDAFAPTELPATGGPAGWRASTYNPHLPKPNSGKPAMQRTISLVLPIVLLLGTPSASAQTGGETSVRQVWLFLGLSEDSGREGFLRVVNHSAQAGEVRIEAVDDDGTHAEPVTLSMGASQTTHLNSEDLERGNASKGLPTGIGPGQGDWRLTLSSTLDLDALSYVRTDDGFVTSMHDTVPTMDDGSLRVAFLNPGSNYRQESHLPADQPERRGRRGSASSARTTLDSPAAATVTADVPAGQTRTFTAAELESGNVTGLSGALGDGVGKWLAAAGVDTGHRGDEPAGNPPRGTWRICPRSPAPGRSERGTRGPAVPCRKSDPSKRQGFLRVVNRSDAAGTVRIEAFDGSDSAYGPVTLTLDADQDPALQLRRLGEGQRQQGAVRWHRRRAAVIGGWSSPATWISRCWPTSARRTGS